MPLDGFGKDEKLNIRNIENLLAEDDKVLFDPHKEVTPAMMDDAARLFASAGLHQEIGVSFIQLFPEESARLDLSPKRLQRFQIRIKELNSEITQYSKTTEATTIRSSREILSTLVSNARILFPKVSTADFDIAPETIEELKKDLEKEWQKNLESYLRRLIEFLVIAPEKKGELGLDEKYEKLLAFASDSMDGYWKTTRFSALRLLFPKRFNLNDREKFIAESVIDVRRALLSQVDTDFAKMINHIKHLLALRILSADRVELTEHGVVFYDGKKDGFKQETPPLPEIKK